jgi:hypothetical protein
MSLLLIQNIASAIDGSFIWNVPDLASSSNYSLKISQGSDPDASNYDYFGPLSVLGGKGTAWTIPISTMTGTPSVPNIPAGSSSSTPAVLEPTVNASPTSSISTSSLAQASSETFNLGDKAVIATLGAVLGVLTLIVVVFALVWFHYIARRSRRNEIMKGGDPETILTEKFTVRNLSPRNPLELTAAPSLKELPENRSNRELPLIPASPVQNNELSQNRTLMSDGDHFPVTLTPTANRNSPISRLREIRASINSIFGSLTNHGATQNRSPQSEELEESTANQPSNMNIISSEREYITNTASHNEVLSTQIQPDRLVLEAVEGRVRKYNSDHYQQHAKTGSMLISKFSSSRFKRLTS